MSNLTTSQARLQDDLRGIVTGDVSCDDATLQLYSTDGSMLQCRPLGVIYPRNAKDVSSVISYASEQGLSVHPRGSGTGTVGGALGAGVILDFSRYMRRVLHVDEEAVLTYPGVIRERLNDTIRKTKNRFFAPSTGHFPTCTLGSILATDCVGPRWLAHSFPHEYVKELEVVTSDGKIRLLKKEKIKLLPDGTPVFGPNSLYSDDEIWTKLISILHRASADIAQEQDGDRPDCAGYRLEGVLDYKSWNGNSEMDVWFDPTRLFSGSEGSLGVITKANLRTFPVSSQSGSVILLFDSLEKAAHSLETIRTFQPTLCDMLDRRQINMVREWDSRFLSLLPAETEIALVVEFNSETVADLNDRMNRLIQQLRDVSRLIFGSRFALHSDERCQFRDLLRKSEDVLLRIRSPFHTVDFLEDLYVPVPFLPDFLHKVQNILSARGVTYSLSGHVGQGQVRILPIFDFSAGEIMEPILSLSNEIYSLTLSLGGSVASAKGTGLARSYLLPSRYPKLFPFFREIKNLFDPNNLHNPGCIIPEGNFVTDIVFKGLSSIETNLLGTVSTDSTSSSTTSSSTTSPRTELAVIQSELPAWTQRLRNYSPDRDDRETARPMPNSRRQLEFQLRWDPRSIKLETFQCTGCGLCRIRTQETRMCPNFRLSAEEYTAPRAKANILRGILEERIPLEALTEDDVHKIGQECLFCHCCTEECPAHANIPKLAFQIISAWNAAHGINLGDRILSNLDFFLEFFSKFPQMTNSFMNRSSVRWFLKKMLGIPQSRKIPPLANRSFLAQIARKKSQKKLFGSRQSRKAALLIDTFSNYFDPALAEAAIKIMEHNNIVVYVPERQRPSGHSAFLAGNGYRAEVLAQKNTTIFVDLIRQGYEVVTLEPSSAVCVQQEYSYVRDDEETILFGKHTTDLCSYLYELNRQGNLQLDFTPINMTIGYHAPCRTLALTRKSVAASTPAQELLQLIPGLNVRRLERGCCGLSGITGLKKDHLSMSVRLGRPLFLALRDSDISFGSTECNTCKIQLEQGANKPAIHPLKIIAYSYGLISNPFESD